MQLSPHCSVRSYSVYAALTTLPLCVVIEEPEGQIHTELHPSERHGGCDGRDLHHYLLSTARYREVIVGEGGRLTLAIDKDLEFCKVRKLISK